MIGLKLFFVFLKLHATDEHAQKLNPRSPAVRKT